MEQLKAIVINSLLKSRIKSIDSTLNKTDKKILNVLKSTQMVFGIKELQTPIPASSHNIEWSIRKLKQADLVEVREGKILPGTSLGRPKKYIYLPGNEKFLKDNGFQRHIVLSLVFCKMLKANWKLVSFDKEIPAPTMNNEDEVITFLSDFTDKERFNSTAQTVL